MEHVSIGFSYQGTFKVHDATIKNLALESSCFNVIASTLNINHTTVSNLTKASGIAPRFLKVELDSTLLLNHTTFNDMQISIINCFSSDMQIDYVTAQNIISTEFIADCYFCTNLVIKHFSLRNSTSDGTSAIINIRETIVNSIEDSVFYDNQPVVFLFQESQIKNFVRNSFDGMNKAIKAIHKTTGTIQDNNFINMVQNIKSGDIYQLEIVSDGSGIEIIDSNMTVQNNTFQNCKARYGGAILVSCNYLVPCENTIRDNRFINNTALKDGGAIKYDSYPPVIENNTFTNNEGIYGNDVASYPVKIMRRVGNTLEDFKTLTDIPSGVKLESEILLSIVDVDGVIIDSINTGSIFLSAITPLSYIKGSNTAALTAGNATLSNVILESSPGDTNIQFKIKSSQIDYQMVQHLEPVEYADLVILVDFRWCKPGEIQISNICSE